MQGIEAGSGEIGVVGDQGVSVQGFRVPRPVQALRVRQTHSQWRTTLAESTGEEQANPAPPSLVPTWPTCRAQPACGEHPSRAHQLMEGPRGQSQAGWLLLNRLCLKYLSRAAP